MQCPSCKLANPPTARFCNGCGFQLQYATAAQSYPSGKVLCPYCRVLTRSDRALCSHCGRNLPGQSVAQSRQETATRESYFNTPERKAWLIGGILVGIILIAFASQMAERDRARSTTTSAPAGSAPQTSQPATAANKPTSKDLLERAKTNVFAGANTERLTYAKTDLELIPANALEYKEAQKLLAQLPGLMKDADAREVNDMRNRLKDSYLELIQKENSHYNYIEAKLTKSGKGFALWAIHEFFGQYEFSAGNDAHVVQLWINQNKQALERTGIVRVGLMGKGAYAGSSYFDLK
jgi:double zinc ribbon protein